MNMQWNIIFENNEMILNRDFLHNYSSIRGITDKCMIVLSEKQYIFLIKMCKDCDCQIELPYYNLGQRLLF